MLGVMRSHRQCLSQQGLKDDLRDRCPLPKLGLALARLGSRGEEEEKARQREGQEEMATGLGEHWPQGMLQPTQPKPEGLP